MLWHVKAHSVVVLRINREEIEVTGLNEVSQEADTIIQAKEIGGTYCNCAGHKIKSYSGYSFKKLQMNLEIVDVSEKKNGISKDTTLFHLKTWWHAIGSR